jgi:hypothetical protein
MKKKVDKKWLNLGRFWGKDGKNKREQKEV